MPLCSHRACSAPPTQPTLQVRDQLLKVQKVVTEGNTKSRVREALILALGGITAAELPASLVQENGREMYSSDLLEKQAKGQIDPAIVKQLLTPPMVQRHIEKNKAVIEKNVLSSLALDALAKELNIVPTEADLSAAVAQTREEFKAMGQEFDEERLRSEIAEARVGTGNHCVGPVMIVTVFHEI